MRVPRTALVLLLVVLALPATGAPVKQGPAEGAWVEYALHASGGAPDGSFRQATDATLLLRFADGAWAGTCYGRTTTWDGGSETVVAFEQPASLAPPAVGRRLHRGDEVDPALTSGAPVGCRHDLGPLVVAGRDVGRTLVATEPAEASAFQDASLSWDARSGLVRSWSLAGRSGGLDGRLVASSGI